MPNLILASGSPRRKEILASLGLEFTILKPDIDETQHAGENPYTYVARLSQEKAQAVANRLHERSAQAPAGVVLAADTVVVAADTIGVAGSGHNLEEDGEILGKPVDPDDARVMLQRLRGTMHVVCTAITLLRLDGPDRRQHTALTRTRVIMRDYTDAEIDAYIATGDPFDKAGGYAIQHEEFAPVASIEGSYTNVVGLPVETLRALLGNWGSPRRPREGCIRIWGRLTIHAGRHTGRPLHPVLCDSSGTSPRPAS
ncbi:MAG: septum formation protein Maf [Chloroflexi bacterium]|nr:septum formation protein Maf [Chloroflexota bacterium]